MDLEAIRVRVARHTALQQAISAALPKSLSRQVRVGYEVRGALVLLADNGVVAARLRHSAPRLLLTIRQRFPEVTAIQIDVQLVHDSRDQSRPVRRIGTTGLASLTSLAANLPEGELRAAVTALLQHQRSDGDDHSLEREESEHDRRNANRGDKKAPRPD